MLLNQHLKGRTASKVSLYGTCPKTLLSHAHGGEGPNPFLFIQVTPASLSKAETFYEISLDCECLDIVSSDM